MKPYYRSKGITIYCGDCLDVAPFLKREALITDPPFGVGLKGKTRRASGSGSVFRRGQYSHPDTPEYLEAKVLPVIRYALARSRRAAITPGTRALWMYPPAKSVGGFYSSSNPGRCSWGFQCLSVILFYGSDPFLEKCLGSRPNSVNLQYCNDSNSYAHPCAKPIRWMEWLVNRCSLEGETVLDPFMGVGTTLVAARNLNRKAIGIEIEEKYCEIAARRLDGLKQKPAPVIRRAA